MIQEKPIRTWFYILLTLEIYKEKIDFKFSKGLKTTKNCMSMGHSVYKHSFIYF